MLISRKILSLSASFLCLVAAACSPAQQNSSSAAAASDAAIVSHDVFAKAETTPVATANDDAADDPAIWRNAGDPQKSLIVGTDKKGGLYVYGLDGKVKHFVKSGRLNNVALLDGVSVGGRPSVLVAASDRSDDKKGQISLYSLDTVAAKLVPIGVVPSIAGEAYGFCLYQSAADQSLYAFVVNKEGSIGQIKLELSGPKPKATTVRTLKLETQAEGCVVDERSGSLYVGEEAAGVWKFNAGASSPVEGTMIAKVDGKQLIADVEGLALARIGTQGGYLLVSSQGDNAYAVFDLSNNAFVGRFRVAAAQDGIDGTVETDGIELALGDFGPNYPDGLFIAQDGDNAPEAQNFKFVSWGDIKTKLGLK